MNNNYTEREIQLFNNILNDYKQIENDTEMTKRGLEYTDYKNLGFILDSLRYEKEASFKSDNIAEWLKSFGCIVNNNIHEYTAQL